MVHLPMAQKPRAFRLIQRARICIVVTFARFRVGAIDRGLVAALPLGQSAVPG